MVEQEKEQSFTVTDRRGASREDDVSPPQQEEALLTDNTASVEDSRQQAPLQDASEPLPDVDFMTLIFSLYTYAQISLGIIPDPTTGQSTKELIQAKYNIDILAILQEKTRGNLSQEEEQALEQMLYELRMNYVQAS